MMIHIYAHGALLTTHRKMYRKATNMARRGGTKPSSAIPEAEMFSVKQSGNGRENPSMLIRKSKNMYCNKIL